MTEKWKDLGLIERDGTGQAARLQEALDPGYVAVDERTVEDLLAFARRYAGELKYYDEDNREAGDWSAFLDARLELDDVAAFMEDPEKYTPEDSPLLYRPHFVLFLVFLELLRLAQGELNTLTRRHLDYYYRRILRLRSKPALPDRVNVLLDLAAGVDPFLLPAGSRLSAGPDSLGKELVYATDRDVVVNRARIEELRSVHVERRITGTREAREAHRNDTPQGCLAMLEIALGDPLPGDPLPLDGTTTVDFAFLKGRAELVRFAKDNLFMELFELHDMMRLKRRRDGADDEWAEINSLLEKAGRTRTGDASWALAPEDPRDFDGNLATAAGAVPSFDGLPEVEDVYDLYDLRSREDAQLSARRDFIRNTLCFADFDDFVRMMQIKVRIDNEWKEVHRILEEAGRRRDPSSTIPSELSATDFAAKLEAAVGPLDFSAFPGVGDIDEYYTAVLRLEEYFFLPAADFAYFMSVVEKHAAAAAEWDEVDRILAKARREKVYRGRRRRLKEIREAEGFSAMVRHALGEEPAAEEDPAVLERLRPFLGRESDLAFLAHLRDAPEEATEEDWQRLDQIVEVAQRNREDLAEPVARKEEWLNLHPAKDATALQVSLGLKEEQELSRWRTFGRAPQEASPGLPPVPVMGWALSSPILAMSEGRRTVTLTLGLRAAELDEAELGEALGKDPFLFELSSEKGWVEAQPETPKIGSYATLAGTSAPEQAELKAMQFELRLGEDADAVTPPPEPAEMESPWPVLRLSLRQLWDEEAQRYLTLYPPFRHLVLAAVHVHVDVSGLATINLQNDDRALDATKPFEPFGIAPAVGSRLLLGHPELVTKKLATLKLRADWMGKPADLSAHYRNYGIGASPSFTTRISLIERRVALDLEESAPLFSLPILHVAELLASYGYERRLADSFGDDLLSWNRYLQLELNSPDFQHQAYPAVASQKAIEMAAAIANKDQLDTDGKPIVGVIDAADYQVNPPYTPKIQSLKLDYTSAQEIRLDGAGLSSPDDRIFHLHPFGYSAPEKSGGPLGRGGAQGKDGVSFLPRYDDEGELYIGLRDLRPPQSLSILFQLAEGSADPDLELETVRWSYLDGDRFESLDEGNVLADTTRGLINSGILEFNLPPAAPGTRLPGRLYWLRAAISHNAQSVCDTVAIHTQAVAATFIDDDNAAEHFSRPLPAGSLTKLASPVPEIAGVRQLYTSYGGRMAEEERMFATRVSERLRHKMRALTMWDYERLVLGRFPEVYKVKCIPANLARNPDDPGRVEVIVIPDIRNKRPFDPFAPKAPADLLAEIEEYLAAKMPAAAVLAVKNAHYVAVKVRLAVRFRGGGNEAYYKERLVRELNRSLSPWAYEEGADIVIGGKIYANSIVDFLERRPYVDYVTDVRLFKSDDGVSFVMAPPPGETQAYAVATERPDGVLVAAREHQIDVIPEAGYETELLTGVNFMKVELDFVVG